MTDIPNTPTPSVPLTESRPIRVLAVVAALGIVAAFLVLPCSARKNL